MPAQPSLRVKRLRPTASLPQRATPHSSGLDVYADLGQTDAMLELTATPTLVPTGIALEVPPGYEVQVRPRSGLSRLGVDVAFGTVDADYRGELKVNMALRGDARRRFVIRHGQRIGQIVVAPLLLTDVEEVDHLTPTERGAGGFGSSGR